MERLPGAYACHCRDRRTWSGSASSLQVIVPEERLEVTGTPAVFELAPPDGALNSGRPGLATSAPGPWTGATIWP